MWYTIHITIFYTCGFLFHLKSQQILLHQPHKENDTTLSLWSMFGETNHAKEDATAVFQRIIHTKLNLKLPKKSIYPVYDYFHKIHNKTHYVCYAIVATMQKHTVLQGSNLSWYTFKEAIKLPSTQQTKQDIMVAQRVIEAQERETMHTQYHSSH